ncbi:inactive ubiquitin carboxyl-terminal hydrolase 50 [Phalacrocorax carbo]|uniref:inactive ubiquitin carboxyl-terminal hydrolase 50 n=1 Tax=Phalacrocorax carbo TaxID=9209 RepID=UPI00311A3A7A
MEKMNSQCPGLTGLRNLGNTCYMNAILQCLCSVPPLVEYFLSEKYKAALHMENGESATAFGCLMSDMWLGEVDCVSPEVFHSVLGKKYPTFSKRTQQDAQEFLICVLNELHEALKKVKAQLWCFGDHSSFLVAFHDSAFHVIIACLPLPNYAMWLLKIVIFIPLCHTHVRTIIHLRLMLHQTASSQGKCITDAKSSKGSVCETSIITQLFEGQLSYDITCLECKTTTNRPESFTILSLPIPSKSRCSLQDCLKGFFQQDTLTWNNQIHCSWCGTKQDAAVKATMTTAPQIIIFHLKRFEWQGEHKRKLSTDICYPLSNLDLSPYSSPHFCKDAEYSLCAVVNHSGFLDDGHYTAFCKHSVTRNWYSFDDAQITKIPDSSVQTNRAYLLFYASQGLRCTH